MDGCGGECWCVGGVWMGVVVSVIVWWVCGWVWW